MNAERAQEVRLQNEVSSWIRSDCAAPAGSSAVFCRRRLRGPGEITDWALPFPGDAGLVNARTVRGPSGMRHAIDSAWRGARDDSLDLVLN